MGFLDRLRGKPKAPPGEKRPIRAEDLPPDMRWLLGCPEYAFWLNDHLTPIQDAWTALSGAIARSGAIMAFLPGQPGRLDEAKRDELIVAVEALAASVTVPEQGIPAERELWPSYSHETYARVLDEIRGLLRVLVTALRESDGAMVSKVLMLLIDERRWQLTDLHTKLICWTYERLTPEQKKQFMANPHLAAQIGLGSFLASEEYLNTFSEAGIPVLF